MNTRDKTKKLANDIRTKIYGSDVREAISTGIEESGNTSQEARDITESLLDGSYDTGLLNTEIEQRMNNLYSTKGQAMDDLYTQKNTELTDLYINEKSELDTLQADYADRAETLETTYAPRLTSAEQDISNNHQEVTAQLAQTENYLADIGINVLKNGATGDGVTDDTSAIQRCINDLIAMGGGKLIMPTPEAHYVVRKPLNIENVSFIEIQGNKVVTPNRSMYLFRLENTSNIIINGVTYECPKQQGSQKLVRAVKVSALTITECEVINGGILLASSIIEIPEGIKYINRDIFISKCKADGGFVSEDIITLSGCENVLLEKSSIKNTNNDGLKTSGKESRNIKIKDNLISHCYDNAIDMYGSGTYFEITSNTIENCLSALSLKSQGLGPSGETVYTNAHTALVQKNTIRNCRQAIYMLRSRNITISNNLIEDNGVWLDGSKGSHIIHIEGNFRDITLTNDNQFIRNKTNIAVISVQPFLDESGLESESFFNVSGNTFSNNEGIQVSVVMVDGAVLMGKINDNNFNGNTGRCVGLSLRESYISVNQNQSLNNVQGIYISNSTTESKLRFRDNDMVKLASGLAFNIIGSGVITQSGNSWNL